MHVRYLAPAKVNIGLRVLPGIQDGFHHIESVFQTIALYDTLTVETIAGCGQCMVNCSGMALPVDNTLTAAYRSFCTETGVTGSVRAVLEKHIPHGAGLGGGSSDAAALIKALDALFGTRLETAAFRRIAAGVGSDVFFFADCLLSTGGAAVVTGRGEGVRRIQKRHDLHFVLVHPDVQSATAEAYRLVDEWQAMHGEAVCPALGDLEAMYQAPVRDWAFANSFTAPLMHKYPVIGDALRSLAEAGAAFVQMSGSGSTVFGVFESGSLASDAYEKLGRQWRAVTSVI